MHFEGALLSPHDAGGFPQLTLDLLIQTYTRTGETTYHYESQGGEFVTDIEVDPVGLVVRYPPLWEREPGG